MSAVEKLFEEHRLIERVVSALDQCVHGLSEDNESKRSDLLRFVTFFREFADLLHHEKEEELLMPALAEAGLRWDEGVMLQIRREHEFERSLLQTLRHLALQTRAWSENDCRRIVDISERFVTFMRAHMALEDERIHRLVLERMSPEGFDALDAKLRRFDEKRELSGEIDLLLNLGEELSVHYAAP